MHPARSQSDTYLYSILAFPAKKQPLNSPSFICNCICICLEHINLFPNFIFIAQRVKNIKQKQNCFAFNCVVTHSFVNALWIFITFLQFSLHPLDCSSKDLRKQSIFYRRKVCLFHSFISLQSYSINTYSLLPLAPDLLEAQL